MTPGIVVKVMSKELAEHGYYKQKVGNVLVRHLNQALSVLANPAGVCERSGLPMSD